MGKRRSETIVKHTKILEVIFRILLPIYSGFLTILSFVFSSVPSGGSKPTGFWQDLAVTLMGQINWILLVGAVIVVVYSVLWGMRGWAKAKLNRPGDGSPCVGTLLKAGYEMIARGDYAQQDCRLSLYRAIAEERLEFFACTHSVAGDVRRISISSHDESMNIGPLAKCWFANLNMVKERNNRTPEYALRNPEPNAKTVIVLPIVVSSHDPAPWGVVCVRCPRALTRKHGQQIVAKLNSSNCLVAAFENLLERQRRVGHFVNFAE